MITFKNYLLNCSFHGLPFIVDFKFHWSERLFWIFSVILSWWVAANIMLSSYYEFQNNAISFTADTSYLEWVTPFPAIIFCEKGNEKYRKYANEWFGKERNFDTDEILKDIVFFQGGLKGMSYKCTKEDCPLAEGNYSFYSDTIRSKCTEIFQFCSWNKEEFSCCSQILSVQTIYGKCYGINSLVTSLKPQKSLPMLVSHTPNIGTGVLAVELLNPDIKIFVQSEEAVPLYTVTSNIVMDGTTTASHYKEKSDIYLSVQEVINEKEVKTTSIKRRGCRFPDENNLLTANVYSYSGCIVDCWSNFQIKKCGCNHHLMPLIKKPCNMAGLICLSLSFEEMMKNSSECDCDTSCTATEISILGSSTTQNYSRFRYDSSITKLNFILQAPTVRCIRKVVNGYLDLIVSMGGTAGLCVGASLLTSIEMFYYLIIRPLNDRRKQQHKGNTKRKIRGDKTNRGFSKNSFPFVN